MLGYHDYRYSTTFIRNNIEKFLEVREWCWEQWGPSCEYEFVYKKQFKPVWCWISDHHGRYRILLETDKETAWYVLKWT